MTDIELKQLNIQLKNLDTANFGMINHDYCGYGCEFILNNLTQSEVEQISYPQISNHLFDYKFETFLFYSPSDIRGLVFDFSWLNEGKVICYNGITRDFTHEIVTEFTIKDFLEVYGFQKFYSCQHYHVKWNKIIYEWRN